MRQTVIASAFAAAALLATSLGSAPAQAQDYPWCRLGVHDCMYSTYAQCMAALSGTFGDCRRNPALGYAEAPVAEPGYAPPYHHHYRHHHRGRHYHQHHH